MTGQPPYAVRFSAPAAKALDALPEHVEDMVWDVLDAAAADPWSFEQWNADDREGEDVRHASVGQLSLTYWVNRPLRRLSVLTITWLG
ncbi:type II toxin-antitoxin system RelE/ParE family toxin [Streptomyces werraensis]|uniref:type II toxin-antitoxin system RelE family toxin n=1 Tax=Streptomyces werraensis TaxID=68284 RepID=UPI0036FC4ED9